MTKQLALSFALLICIGLVAGHTQAQGTLDQRVSELSKQISDGLTENQKRTIAVVEFVDLKGNVTDFGRFLAEELITRLYQTKKFKVIERQLLNKIVTEQKLSLTGIIDQTSAQKLGKLLGVDAIATGTVTDLGKSLRINARLIDTGTAEIFAVASTEITRDAAVIKLMGPDESTVNSAERSPGAGQPTSTQRRPLQKIDANFFTFELQQCLMSGTSVICDLTITNNGDDRKIGLGNQSKLFDDQGNEYSAVRVRIASNDGQVVYANLVSGIAARVRLTFEGVSALTRGITLLDVFVVVETTSSSFHVQFRGIPLRPQGSADRGVDDAKSGTVIASIQSNEDRTITVNGNEHWTDTRIDVWPGMRLEVVAAGRVYITNEKSASSQILGSIVNRGNPLPMRSVGTGSLLAKIRYTRGGESNTIRVGDKNTLMVEEGEAGRLLFGVDDKNVRDNSGHFTVRVRW